jgi:predicted adenine nucleotide alpha hydrolase (AANH) superfamily ATPase
LTGSRISFEEEGIDVTGLWYNPNIHPWTENDRRLQTLQRYIYLRPMKMIYLDEYPLYEFICGMMGETCEIGSEAGMKMSENEREKRCSYCYRKRLLKTANEAKERGFDSFSTTMLISKHQDHSVIRKIGNEIGEEADCDFIYMDLRKRWKDSIKISKDLRMYRQPYCGCIFSEQERYAGSDGFSNISKE